MTVVQPAGTSKSVRIQFAGLGCHTEDSLAFNKLGKDLGS